MDNQAALTYLVKMARTRNLLMIQEAKEILEFFLANQITLTAGDFKYLGRQDFQENEKFVKRMDMKQANISETHAGFRTSGSVCVQVVPPDPKVHKLATRSTCMDGGCISEKLVTSKSICLPTFCSYREGGGQSKEGQV